MKKKMLAVTLLRRGFIAAVALASGALTLDYYLVGRKIVDLPSSIRVPARAVLHAHLFEEYWENELYSQKPTIDMLSVRERVSYYALIAIYCDLSNYRANYFEEIAAPDGEELLAYLEGVVRTEEYNGLSDNSKKRVKYWLERLPTVVQEREREKMLQKHVDKQTMGGK